MAINALLSEEELCLYEILRHPIFCAEFLRNIDITEDSKPWELASYQEEMLADHGKFVSLCCGRVVGKSETILDKVSFYMINNFFTHDPISIVTPNRVHLEPLFNKLRRWLTTHSFLKHYVARKGLNSAIFNIIALNGFQLDCRIAGTGTSGANVMGLHAPIILLDEAGIFPWPVWIELQPCLNGWMAGSQMFIAGVPIGQRERNVLYFADQVDPNVNRFNISQHQNPRYSEADEIRNQKQFGGTDSEEYIHLVLGRHGTPVYAMFDRTKMLIESYDVFVSKVYGLKLKSEPRLLADLLRIMPNPPKRVQKLAIGVDLGYTEPSVFTALYLQDNVWKFLFRITMYQVPYPKQQQFIAELDMKYNPDFIGIDAGGPGKVVIQNLINAGEYLKQQFGSRLVPIDFNTSISVGFDHNGEEMKERAKIYAMQKLQEMTNNHGILYSSVDEEVITELERTVYTRTASGNIVYKTLSDRGGKHGDDHNLASLISFVLGWYYKFDSNFCRQPSKKLWQPRWI